MVHYMPVKSPEDKHCLGRLSTPKTEDFSDPPTRQYIRMCAQTSGVLARPWRLYVRIRREIKLELHTNISPRMTRFGMFDTDFAHVATRDMD